MLRPLRSTGRSQSPQLGASFRSLFFTRPPPRWGKVSIPSNRGVLPECSNPEGRMGQAPKSQSPQIGASFRRMESERSRALDRESQSPQIGASFRSYGRSATLFCRGLVSIPSNRGVLPEPGMGNYDEEDCPRLNPLNSGRPSGAITPSRARGRCARHVSIPSNRGVLPEPLSFCISIPIQSKSQSPQIGASFRSDACGREIPTASAVSIPSNRGVLPEIQVTSRFCSPGSRRNPLKSGRPSGVQSARSTRPEG